MVAGALQKTNQMDIESLLNPAGRFHILTETSDIEIYQAVINAINACEDEDMEINGGDDVNEIPLTWCPHDSFNQ